MTNHDTHDFNEIMEIVKTPLTKSKKKIYPPKLDLKTPGFFESEDNECDSNPKENANSIFHPTKTIFKAFVRLVDFFFT